MTSLKYLPLLLAGAVAFAGDQAPASKRPHVRIGGIFIGAGYSHFSGGFPYYGYYPGYWGYGPLFYDPFLFGPYIHPGFFTGFAYQPNMGNVKLHVGENAGWVYLDGALAGRVDKLKDMWLEPGAYNLEIQNNGQRLARRIYVLSGKTLKVTPDMLESEVRQ